MIENENKIGSIPAATWEKVVDLIWQIVKLLTGIDRPGVTAPPIGDPLLDEHGEQGWQNLIRLIKEDNSRAEHFNVAFLAQCILESGRGTSLLSKEHFNYAGLKYRKELEGVAFPVSYNAHDGKDQYCGFKSDADFIKGYWLFIQRYPYKGWEQCETAYSYLTHLKKAGYAADSNYVSKLLPLCEEAKRLLDGSSYEPPDRPDDEKPLPDADSAVKGTLVIKRGHTKAAPGASMVDKVGPNEWFYYGPTGGVNKMAQDYAFRKYPNLKVVEVLRDGLSISQTYVQRVKAQNPTHTIETHFNSAANKAAYGTETLCSSEALDQKFAGILQKKICAVFSRSGMSRGVKPISKSVNGGSAVWALPGIPNALIEPAFGSNLADAKMLVNKKQELAEAMIESVAEDIKGR